MTSTPTSDFDYNPTRSKLFCLRIQAAALDRWETCLPTKVRSRLLLKAIDEIIAMTRADLAANEPLTAADLYLSGLLLLGYMRPATLPPPRPPEITGEIAPRPNPGQPASRPRKERLVNHVMRIPPLTLANMESTIAPGERSKLLRMLIINLSAIAIGQAQQVIQDVIANRLAGKLQWVDLRPKPRKPAAQEPVQ